MAAQQHVAVLAFPFTSHPIALFNFVSSLATAAPKIQFSLFSSAKSNNSILSTAQNPRRIPANIRTYNVDDGCVSDGDIGLVKEINCFLNEFPGNSTASMDAVQMETGKRITCFITDAFFSSAVCKTAKDMNVPWILFWVPAPHVLPAYLEVDLIQQIYDNNAQAQQQPGGVILHDIIPGFSPISLLDLPSTIFQHEYRYRDSAKQMRSVLLSKTMSEASTVVMNSYQEINPAILTDYLKSKF
ncbi:UDP-glucosyltransferase, putative [Ricinus communis]|uniref:UDP-glucosyltransferase, putative n=1 Tax=Ricinus communis TaxID=3988 RepID=B9RY56_RICCO|nr:UDP-glucosyltransferase, putative [Ricinus communis]|eukprot:XP_002518640.1 kaempferol 3-O-beta-D-galactosyltransferase [Ricinus communis]